MIHSTAIIEPGAKLGNNVSVGPYSYIGNDVVIGDDCIIESHVVIKGPSTIGSGNHIFQFASVGEACQDKKYNNEPTTLIMGDNNVIRECATIHRGTIQDQGVTKIGSNNLFMAYTHVAHDAVIGNNVGKKGDGGELGAVIGGVVGGVAGIQVREHKYRGLACDLAVRRLASCDAFDGRCIVLEWSVYQQIRPALASDPRRLPDFLDILAAAGLSGAVTDHGNHWLDTEGLRRFGALDGDVGQLFRVRVRVDGTITVYQHLFRQQHEEY